MWEEHFDDNYKAPYWYNKSTGESVWVKPDEFQSSSSKKKKKKDEAGSTPITAPVDFPPIADDVDDDDASMMASFETAELLPTSSDLNRVSLILDQDRVYADTEPDIKRYSRSLYATACIIEGPAAIIEGITRGAAFITAAGVFCLLAVARWRHQRTAYIETARSCMREAFLSWAAVISMLIPGIVCLVYKRQDGEGDWELSPLPTVLGWVDVRRFAAFSLFGAGRLATWAGMSAPDRPSGILSIHAADADLDLEEDVLQAAAHKVVERLSDLHLPAAQCQDTWQGPILCYPRKLHQRMQEILKGESERTIERALEQKQKLLRQPPS